MFRIFQDLKHFGLGILILYLLQTLLLAPGQGRRMISLGLHQSLAAAGLKGVTLLRGGHLVNVPLAAQSGQRQDTSVWLSSGPRLLSYLFLFQIKAGVLDQRQ